MNKYILKIGIYNVKGISYKIIIFLVMTLTASEINSKIRIVKMVLTVAKLGPQGDCSGN